MNTPKPKDPTQAEIALHLVRTLEDRTATEDDKAHAAREILAMAARLDALTRFSEDRSQVVIYGTDACKNCATGRITLYARSCWCTECRSTKRLNDERKG